MLLSHGHAGSCNQPMVMSIIHGPFIKKTCCCPVLILLHNPASQQGLGKTLQASCIMAAAVIDQTAVYHASLTTPPGTHLPPGSDPTSTASAPCPESTPPFPQPCLVVCPSTLVAHWAHEVGRYISQDVLRPLQYQGLPGDRVRTQVSLGTLLDQGYVQGP